MTLGELLKQAIDWLWAFWPIRVVHDWEQGVRCFLGQAQTRLTSHDGLFRTGLHVCWPFLGQLLIDETNIEVVETDIQTVVTADGRPVTFSLGIQYRVANLCRMYQSIHDARETLYNALMSYAGHAVVGMDYESIADELCDRVVRETKQLVEDWGIELISLHLINVCEARPLRLITNQGRPSPGLHEG